jgi:hypothetical protein
VKTSTACRPEPADCEHCRAGLRRYVVTEDGKHRFEHHLGTGRGFADCANQVYRHVPWGSIK